jgi:hypothetical protein
LVLLVDQPFDPAAVVSVTNDANQTSTIHLGTFTHVQFFNVSIRITVPPEIQLSIYFWLMPAGFCGSTSYSLSADRTISFELSTPNLSSDFCVFSQPSASSYEIEFDFESPSLTGQLEFYRDLRKMADFCKSRMSCSVNSGSPFFIRLFNLSNYRFNANVTLTVFHNTIQPCECAWNPATALIDGRLTVPTDLVSLRNLQCISMSEAVVSLIYYIGIVLFGIIVAMLLLHLIGFFDIKEFCGWRAETKHFDSLRGDPYAHQLDSGIAIPANEPEIVKL